MGATGAIDVSDGLVEDLGISPRRAEYHRARPTNPVARASRPSASASGEEYEVVVSTHEPLDLEAFFAAFRLPLTPIAHAIAGDPGVELRRKGRRVANPGGHDHFST